MSCQVHDMVSSLYGGWSHTGGVERINQVYRDKETRANASKVLLCIVLPLAVHYIWL